MKIKRRQPLCEFDAELEQGVTASVDPLLKRIYENRNISTASETQYSLKQLHPPSALKGIDAATDLVVAAIKDDGLIVIIGDYDTDGATATTLAMLGLASLGARNVQYLVPNRFEYGYGLSEKIAKLALDSHPGLVVTVDNGISSIDGVALLKENGVKTVITDHHLAGRFLPDADAIVNPNQPGCDFPSKALAGVGVMFYLLLSIRAKLRQQGWFADKKYPEPNLADYLDLVALGTVADMVPLDFNNRLLVAQGLARIRSGKCRAGIIELLNVANKNHQSAVSSDFGFVIGPRLNAAGRLDDISTGIDCLLSQDPAEAREYAQILNEINVERRKIEQVMQHRAFDIVRTLRAGSLNQQPHPDGYCLFDENWHQGVTGLVASRVKEETNQPAIAFAMIDGGQLTGSARTIAGLHIRDLLEGIAEEVPGLIIKFGGHAMAAGLTIEHKRLDDFRSRFHRAVSNALSDMGDQDFAIWSDGELSDDVLTLASAEMLRNAAPWGQGFPGPMFDGLFDVIEQRTVGGQHVKFKLKSLNGVTHDGIAFKAIEPGTEAPKFKRINAVYQLDVNEFRGQRSLQLIIDQFEEADRSR